MSQWLCHHTNWQRGFSKFPEQGYNNVSKNEKGNHMWEENEYLCEILLLILSPMLKKTGRTREFHDSYRGTINTEISWQTVLIKWLAVSYLKNFTRLPLSNKSCKVERKQHSKMKKKRHRNYLLKKPKKIQYINIIWKLV